MFRVRSKTQYCEVEFPCKSESFIYISPFPCFLPPHMSTPSWNHVPVVTIPEPLLLLQCCDEWWWSQKFQFKAIIWLLCKLTACCGFTCEYRSILKVKRTGFNGNLPLKVNHVECNWDDSNLRQTQRFYQQDNVVKNCEWTDTDYWWKYKFQKRKKKRQTQAQGQTECMKDSSKRKKAVKPKV